RVADNSSPRWSARQRAGVVPGARGRDDPRIQPTEKLKLSNISKNPKVTLALDVTDIGRDIIRIERVAEHADDVPLADQQPQYAAKYAERIGAMFGTPCQFAELFSEALIITPHRLRAY